MKQASLTILALWILSFSAHSIVDGQIDAQKWGPFKKLESRIIKIIFFGPDLSLSSCTGVQLTDQVIMTAAHCLDNKRGMPKPAELTYYENGEETKFSLNTPSIDFEVITHPDYSLQNPSQLSSDIGLIILKRGQLPHRNNFDIHSGGDGMFDDPSHIMARRSLVFGTSRQQMDTLASLFVKMEMFNKNDNELLFKTKKASQLICKGDSGGPVVQYHRNKIKLYGLVSKGVAPQGDCSNKFIITFIDDNKRAWINSFL